MHAYPKMNDFCIVIIVCYIYTFSRSCALKSKISKNVFVICSNPERVENNKISLYLLRFLSSDSTNRSVSNKYLNKINLKKLKLLLFTGEIEENVY